MDKNEVNVLKTSDKKSDWKRDALIYMTVWAACVLWFRLGIGGGGWIMAYTILSFGVILPVTTSATAFRLERKLDRGYPSLIVLGFLSVMYAAALLLTFVLSTYLGETKISVPSPYVFLIGLCSAVIGIVFGRAVRTEKMSPRVPVIAFVILIVFCYVILKTMNGSLLRPVPALDVPAALLLISGLRLCFKRARKGRQADGQT